MFYLRREAKVPSYLVICNYHSEKVGSNLMISIITAVYNAENTIQKTLDSVRKIKNQDIEYIVVDGKSTDATCKIIEKNRDIIDVYISERDCGIYDAINKGIKAASGDYTLFLAADDLLIPGSIDKFKNSVKNDTDVWSGSVIFHNEYGYFFLESDKNLDKLKRECSLRHPATFFKRGIFEKYGYYDTTLKCSGDREIFLRLYLHGAKFQIENIPVEIFNIGGISTANPLDLPIKEGKIIEKKYGFYTPVSNDKLRRIFKRRLKNSLLGYWLLNIYYSDICYYFISNLLHIPIKKISQDKVSEIMGKHGLQELQEK